MEIATPSSALTGVVPPVCDAEAGHQIRIVRSSSSDASSARSSLNDSCDETTVSKNDAAKHGFSVQRLRMLMAELCTAIRGALDDERASAEDSLRRATEILEEIGVREMPRTEP